MYILCSAQTTKKLSTGKVGVVAERKQFALSVKENMEFIKEKNR